MNFLQNIISAKRAEIAEHKRVFPPEKFRGNIVPSDRDFYGALEARKRTGVPAFILECKKASPSQGLIRADFVPEEIGKTYARYADAISVLCDEKFFLGTYENIPRVRTNAPQPILCKDFIIDEYQIFLARFFGADAVLLMLSVLSDEEYSRLAAAAHALNMGVLTETDSAADIERANRFRARVIGINNRNLRTLETDLAVAKTNAALVHENAVCVSESGTRTHADALAMSDSADAFLVGTSLMRERDLDRACRKLIFGENKVCGLTRAEDASAARDAGAVFGGLIFAENSPRKISRECAKKIVAETSGLDFVGVFQNATLEEIAVTATELNLFAVQLHGDEDPDFAENLRARLPASVQIWKAVSMGDAAYCRFRKNARSPSEEISSAIQNSRESGETPLFPGFARLVFDNARGGTGTPFDWKRIPEALKNRALLAGGISPENAREAHRVGCLGLDFNSGVEIAPGIKSAEKIRKAFSALRAFGNRIPVNSERQTLQSFCRAKT